jgi:hypothetical protein
MIFFLLSLICTSKLFGAHWDVQKNEGEKQQQLHSLHPRPEIFNLQQWQLIHNHPPCAFSEISLDTIAAISLDLKLQTLVEDSCLTSYLCQCITWSRSCKRCQSAQFLKTPAPIRKTYIVRTEAHLGADKRRTLLLNIRSVHGKRIWWPNVHIFTSCQKVCHC